MVAVLIECTECLTISLLTSNLLSRAQVSVLPKAPSVLFLNRQLFPKLIQHCMSTTLHEKRIFLRIKTFIQIQTIISLEAEYSVYATHNFKPKVFSLLHGIRITVGPTTKYLTKCSVSINCSTPKGQASTEMMGAGIRISGPGYLHGSVWVLSARKASQRRYGEYLIVST